VFGFGRVTNNGGNAPDSNIVIQDALAILRYLVGLPSVIDNCDDARVAAIITSPGGKTPQIQDALQILRRLVGLPNMIDNPELR
jgi:hypothetical protein